MEKPCKIPTELRTVLEIANLLEVLAVVFAVTITQWLVLASQLLCGCVYVVDTAVCRSQSKQLHSCCGRRNGITSSSRLLKCLQIIATGVKQGLVYVTFHHKWNYIMWVELKSPFNLSVYGCENPFARPCSR